MADSSQEPLYTSSLPGRKPAHVGKVRDMYDLGEEYLMVTTDRLSAFDVVFPNPVPGKGRVLTRLSAYWFRTLPATRPNHFIAEPKIDWLAKLTPEADRYVGRCLRIKKCEPIKVECVVRGNLEGSAWQEYQERGAVMEHKLPPSLNLHDRLPEPIFSPAAKAVHGHDENITFDQCCSMIGADLSARLRDWSLRLFTMARERLARVSITLADTKFEYGLLDGEPVLIDEVLTPDSSRFLITGPNGEPVPMDKQFVRDWVNTTKWNKRPPAPELPADVVRQTSERYREIARLILGEEAQF